MSPSPCFRGNYRGRKNSSNYKALPRNFWPGFLAIGSSRASLPPDDAGAPGETAAQCLQQHEMAGPDAAVGNRLVKRQRDRGCRRVGMALDRDDGPVRRQPEPAPDRLDDARVRLMRHQPVDIGGAQTVCRQCLVDHLAQMLNRLAEYLAAFHPQEAGGAGRGWAAIDIEDVVQA